MHGFKASLLHACIRLGMAFLLISDGNVKFIVIHFEQSLFFIGRSAEIYKLLVGCGAALKSTLGI